MCEITWQQSLGITFWNLVDLFTYAFVYGSMGVFVYVSFKWLLNHFDLNKEPLRR